MNASTPEDPPVGMPKPGTTFVGKYRIESVLGVGGMGVVYAAVHVHLDERVALKLIRPECAEPQFVERFLREGRAAVKVRSPHIARVHDVGTDERGLPYLVLEYLEGSDLAGAVGALPVETAVDYIVQACDALAHAHALGIVHRDLKPSNLFAATTADGVIVKVLDFGIAKAPIPDGTVDLALTKTHGTMGSPLYMSPEQVRSVKDVDARTDIWGLGVTLHELVTGNLPFDGPTLTALAAAITADVPRSLRATRGDVSKELDDIVARCLEKNPDDRFSTILELAEALTPYGTAETLARLPRIARAGSGSDPRVQAGRGSDPRLSLRGSDPRLSPAPTRRSGPHPAPKQTVPIGAASSGNRSASSSGHASQPQPQPLVPVIPPDATVRQTSSAWGRSTDERSSRRALAVVALTGAGILAIVGGGLGFFALHGKPPADVPKPSASITEDAAVATTAAGTMPVTPLDTADPASLTSGSASVPSSRVGVAASTSAPSAAGTGTGKRPFVIPPKNTAPASAGAVVSPTPPQPPVSAPTAAPAPVDSSGLVRNRHGG